MYLMTSPLADEPVELRPQPHCMDHDRLVAAQAGTPISSGVPSRAGPVSIVRSSSISIFRIALRAQVR